MNNLRTKQSLNGPETVVAGRFCNLASSNLEPLKSVFEGLTSVEREAQIAALIAGCGIRFWWPDEPTAISLTPSFRGCSSVVTQTPTSTIPCHVRLGPALTNPARANLCRGCGRAPVQRVRSSGVGWQSLRGWCLYLWSRRRDGW